MTNIFRNNYTLGAVLISVIFLIATNLYPVMAYLGTPDGHTYTGVNLFAGADKLIYLSMIEQGQTGGMMMLNLHTSEPQKGLFFSPHWWVIGKTANLINQNSVLAYEIWRIITSLSFLILFFIFLKRLFKDPLDRLLASLVPLFALGFGWYSLIINPAYLATSKGAYQRLAVDIYLAEAFPILSFEQSPLFILSYFLLLLICYLFIKWRNTFVWWHEVLIGTLTFIFILIHPYDIWIIAPLLGLWTLVKFKRSKNLVLLKKLGIFSLFVLTASVYLFMTLKLEPAMAGWLKQNLVYSPPLGNYLIGFGVVTPLWFYGSYIVWQKYKDNVWWLLILLWSWYIWFIIYLPLQYNRRFTEAWFIPLGLIAYVGLKELVLKYKSKIYRSAMAIVFFILLFGGTFLNLASQTLSLTYQQDKKMLFIPNIWLDTLDELKQISEPEDIVLASTGFGNSFVASYSVPAFTGRRVYIGSKHQTVDYFLKQQRVDEFFSSNNGMDKKTFLEQESIDYIFIDLEDAPEGSYSWLLEQEYLELVSNNDRVLLFRVL